MTHTLLINCDPPRQTHQSRLRAYRIGKFCRIVKAKPDALTADLTVRIAQEVAKLRAGKPCLFHEGIPLHCSITWGFPFPAAVKARDRKQTQWRTQRPDLDNLSKTILDGLTEAGAWADDAQVCRLTLEKHNAPNPFVQITITPSL